LTGSRSQNTDNSTSGTILLRHDITQNWVGANTGRRRILNIEAQSPILSHAVSQCILGIQLYDFISSALS